ncbi:hypothetical protein D3C81_2188280 [compost metagenome]
MAVYISVLMLILLIGAVGAELAMVILPWSNTTEKTVTRQWSEMLKRLKAEQEGSSDKKRQTNSKIKKSK